MITVRESNESVVRTADSTAAASLPILTIYFAAGWQAGRGADVGAMAAAGENVVREAVLCRGYRTWGPALTTPLVTRDCRSSPLSPASCLVTLCWAVPLFLPLNV